MNSMMTSGTIYWGENFFCNTLCVQGIDGKYCKNDFKTLVNIHLLALPKTQNNTFETMPMYFSIITHKNNQSRLV